MDLTSDNPNLYVSSPEWGLVEGAEVTNPLFSGHRQLRRQGWT
jgi:hypothetical protein